MGHYWYVSTWFYLNTIMLDQNWIPASVYGNCACQRAQLTRSLARRPARRSWPALAYPAPATGRPLVKSCKQSCFVYKTESENGATWNLKIELRTWKAATPSRRTWNFKLILKDNLTLLCCEPIQLRRPLQGLWLVARILDTVTDPPGHESPAALSSGCRTWWFRSLKFRPG